MKSLENTDPRRNESVLLTIPRELRDVIISEVFQPCVLDLYEWFKKLCIKYPDKEKRRRMDGEDCSI